MITAVCCFVSAALLYGKPGAQRAKTKTGNTQARWIRRMNEKPFNRIRNLKVIETRPEHLIGMLELGTVSTNICLRRLPTSPST